MPDDAVTLIQNRIVGYDTIPAGQITPHPLNPRRHPQLQRDVVKASLETLGMVAPIIINRRNSYLVDGEERTWTYLQMGDDFPVPVIYVDLSDEEHERALEIFDASGELAVLDRDRLMEIISKHPIEDNGALAQLRARLQSEAGLNPAVDFDPYAEWEGMPEFENETIKPYHSLILRFKSKADMHAFAALVEQPITDKTSYLYYPKQIPMDNKLNRVVLDES